MCVKILCLVLPGWVGSLRHLCTVEKEALVSWSLMLTTVLLLYTVQGPIIETDAFVLFVAVKLFIFICYCIIPIISSYYYWSDDAWLFSLCAIHMWHPTFCGEMWSALVALDVKLQRRNQVVTVAWQCAFMNVCLLL